MFIFYIALFVWPFLAPGWWSLFIVEFILSLIIYAHLDSPYQYDRPSFFGWFVAVYIPYVIATLILGGMYPQLSKPGLEEKVEQAEVINILSLGNQTEVHGSFALGYGSVGTYPAYLSKRQLVDGGYETFLITGKTTLYEDAPDKEKATLVVFNKHEREVRRNVPDWVLYVTKEDKHSDWRRSGTFNHVHVPKGTILRDFKS